VASRTGYTFGGYFTEPGGQGTRFSWADGQISHTAADIPVGSRTLYAAWTANVYGIGLDGQGGSGPAGAIYQRVGDGYYLDAACTDRWTSEQKPLLVASRTGYTFGG